MIKSKDRTEICDLNRTLNPKSKINTIAFNLPIWLNKNNVFTHTLGTIKNIKGRTWEKFITNKINRDQE